MRNKQVADPNRLNSACLPLNSTCYPVTQRWAWPWHQKNKRRVRHSASLALPLPPKRLSRHAILFYRFARDSYWAHSIGRSKILWFRRYLAACFETGLPCTEEMKMLRVLLTIVRKRREWLDTINGHFSLTEAILVETLYFNIHTPLQRR